VSEQRGIDVGDQGVAGGAARPAAAAPGVRLGLPAEGSGSVASLGARLGGFCVDALLCVGVSLLFFGVPKPGDPPWSTVVFVVMYVVFTAAFGQTPGMRVARIRVRRVTGDVPLGLGRAVLRTFVLCLLVLCFLVPALLTDRDSRGIHDRLAGSVVVRV
jgi:uncharacterized RDD family membrane protein YckC